MPIVDSNALGWYWADTQTSKGFSFDDTQTQTSKDFSLGAMGQPIMIADRKTEAMRIAAEQATELCKARLSTEYNSGNDWQNSWDYHFNMILSQLMT